MLLSNHLCFTQQVHSRKASPEVRNCAAQQSKVILDHPSHRRCCGRSMRLCDGLPLVRLLGDLREDDAGWSDHPPGARLLQVSGTFTSEAFRWMKATFWAYRVIRYRHHLGQVFVAVKK